MSFNVRLFGFLTNLLSIQKILLYFVKEVRVAKITSFSVM